MKPAVPIFVILSEAKNLCRSGKRPFDKLRVTNREGSR